MDFEMISNSILIYNTKLGMSGDKVLYHLYKGWVLSSIWSREKRGKTKFSSDYAQQISSSQPVTLR